MTPSDAITPLVYADDSYGILYQGGYKEVVKKRPCSIKQPLKIKEWYHAVRKWLTPGATPGNCRDRGINAAVEARVEVSTDVIVQGI
jgi:hypothetical protein